MPSPPAARVVLSAALPAPGMRRLAAAGLDLLVLPAPTEAALLAAAPAADAIVLVDEQPALSGPVIAAAGPPAARLPQRRGVRQFRRAGADPPRHPLVTTGGANADAVAEHAIHLLLALAKRGPLHDRRVRAGVWSRERGAVELRDKVAAVIGWGRIGRRIGHLAQAFGMRVLPVDPAAADGMPLDDALPIADAVILALPLTPATRHLIDAGRLARMKPSAFLVNVARGAVVDQAALTAALLAGRLAGAGLDVLEEEPPDPADPLLALDTVVLSPHIAASCPEAVERVALACAEAVIQGLAGDFRDLAVVNPEVLAGR
jgi:D-3-phosphoglycerate dehydrogenase